ncbi:unnamed protein product, partial [Ixodes hexagonus]
AAVGVCSSESPSRMQVEIQVALNFLVSFLYNKLPRRRVNQFAEELDRALRRKFRGHWYPDKPYRGSAFRCVKTSPPLDPVFQVAARESGLDLRDVRENLPPDLSIWIDPGEVSYRLGEKGVAQILLGGSTPSSAETRTVTNNSPGIDETLAAQLAGLGLGPAALLPPAAPPQPPVAAPANAAAAASRALTFTTASFAQTKFGSTKLKTSSKRAQRLSPTELGLRRDHGRPAPVAAHDIFVPGLDVFGENGGVGHHGCPTSRFPAAAFLPTGSLPAPNSASELGAALQQHLLLAN